MNKSIIPSVTIFFTVILCTFSLTFPAFADFSAAEVGNTIPTEMHPGETRSATITMENTGTDTWVGPDGGGTPENVRLHAPDSTWGVNTSYYLGAGETIATGEIKEFTILITAPAEEAVTDCVWQMQTRPDNQYFGDLVSVPVNVANSVIPELDAAIDSHTIPSQINTSETVGVMVTVRNTGTTAWDGNNQDIRFRTRNDPEDLWGPIKSYYLDPADMIQPNETKTFTFNITGPVAAGNTPCKWQMQKEWSIQNTFFGELLDVPVQVGTECTVDEDCDDGISCTDDTCDASTCTYTSNDANCPDDGLYCNGTEFCDSTLDCSSSGDPCSPQICDEGSDTCVDCTIDEDCDDGISCTDDTCTSGTCTNTPNNANCSDDGLYCNGTEFCDASLDCSSTGDPCAPDLCDETLDECAVSGDFDEDGVPDISDNCPQTPNGPLAGTCLYGTTEGTCTANEECGLNGFCSMNQEDNYPPPAGNGLGDACECEGDFDCDGDVDGSDANLFKRDFGRSYLKNPCPSCQ